MGKPGYWFARNEDAVGGVVADETGASAPRLTRPRLAGCGIVGGLNGSLVAGSRQRENAAVVPVVRLGTVVSVRADVSIGGFVAVGPPRKSNVSLPVGFGR